MKKILLLVSIAVLSATIGSAAVDSTSTAIWQIKHDKAGQNFIKNDHMTRSIALNKRTNHLLVATRTGGHRIVVLDASRGDSLAQLNMTGVSGGTYHLNKVAVAEDGVIFGCNLNTGNGFKIYRWQDETAAATVAADTTVAGATRFGDAFNVIGQGLDTKIYITGNEASSKSRVTILGTADGSKFKVETMVLAASIKATDIFPVDSEMFWLTAPGLPMMLYNVSGVKIAELGSDVIPGAASAMWQFAYFGHYYLAAFDGNQASARARLVQLGDVLPNATTNVIYKNLGANANTNGVGALVVDPDSDRVFVLGTNNSISSFHFGSYAIWPLAWRVKADTTAWFGTFGEVRSVAYSPATKHLYVASRRGGTLIKVFDPVTGKFIKDLNNAGVGGGTYNLNMITATNDGQVFVGNLALSGVNYKLYHWANEDAAPVKVFDSLLQGRVGDALACTGTGKNVEVYASGNDNPKIYTFNATDSSAFVRGADMSLPEAGAACYGIAPVNGKDYFFVSGPGKPIRYMKRDGTVLHQFDTAEVSGVSARYYEVPTLMGISRKYLMIANGSTPGVSVVELYGEDGDNLCSYYEKVPNMTPLSTNNANTNATAQAVYDLENNQLIELTTNNFMAAYSFANIEPNAGIAMAEPVFSTLSLDFGNIQLPSGPIEKTFWVTNMGSVPWQIAEVFVNLEMFNTEVIGDLTVDAGDTVYVKVTCTPANAGIFEDVVTFVTDTGIFEVELAITLTGLQPVPFISAGGIDFGRVPLRSVKMASFYVTNTGAAPWDIYEIDPGHHIFDTSVDAAFSVNPGDTTTITVYCQPDTAAQYNVVARLKSNAGEFPINLAALGYEMWPVLWRDWADSTDWFYKETNRDQVQTLQYNRETNHLIAVSRVGGTFLKVLDANTGKIVKDMITTGISGGTNPANMAAVTADGQIFVGNLAIANGSFKLYYWANEAAYPVKVFDGVLEGRVGDALGVAGTGKKITVFASGLDNTKLFTFKTDDGVILTRGADIPLPEKNAAGYAISPVDSDYVFIQGPGMKLRYLKKDGTVVHAFDRAVTGGTTSSYFEVETIDGSTRRFVAACDGYTPGTQVVELFGAPGDGLCSLFGLVPAKTPIYSNRTNSYGSGQIAFDRFNNALVEMATNNGITSYDFAGVVSNPKTYTLCMPISAAKVDANGDFIADLIGQKVTVCGIITTPNYRPGGVQCYLQDESGGVNLFSSKFAKDLKIGDKILVTGLVDQYRGLVEIIPDKAEDIQITGADYAVVARPITKADLNEANESILAQVFRYRLVDAAKWPASGRDGTVRFTNGTDSVDVFIDKDMGISGTPAITGWINLTGVAEQFTSKVPPDNGYELRPRSLADLILITGVENRDQQGVPTQFALKQNYPNPFNPATTIAFDAPEAAEIKISVYDLLGKEVALVYEGKLNAGNHTFQFSGVNLPSGIYFYRVESAKFIDMKKMTLIK